MRISAAGIELVKRSEGLRLTAYRDPVGVLTIGYGHTGADVVEGLTITPERATELLLADLAEAEGAVARLVTVPISQPQFDALTSWTFNLGARALETSTLLRLLNAGDHAGAAAQFDRWVLAGGKPLPGLVRRRAEERALFESAITPPAAPAQERPMAPIALVGPLIRLLAGVAPDLLRIFTDSEKPVSDRNTEAAIKVLDLAKSVSGVATPAAAVEAIVGDPALAQAFRAGVQATWYELVPADGGGVEGARKALVQATAGGDWRALGYGVIVGVLALMIVGGGGALIWVLLTDPNTNAEQRGMLIGAVVALLGSVTSFFFGSSVSSRSKDAALVDRLNR